MRQITITVNAVTDVQTKSTQGGKAYIEFRAVNHEYNISKKENDTFWIRVLSFNPQHNGIAKHIKKGSSLIISGEYVNSTYVRKDGSVEIDNTIYAHSIAFNGGTSANNTEAQEEAAPTVAAPVETEVRNPSTKKTRTKKEEPKPVEAPSLIDDSDDDDLPF